MKCINIHRRPLIGYARFFYLIELFHAPKVFF